MNVRTLITGIVGIVLALLVAVAFGHESATNTVAIGSGAATLSDQTRSPLQGGITISRVKLKCKVVETRTATSNPERWAESKKITGWLVPKWGLELVGDTAYLSNGWGAVAVGTFQDDGFYHFLHYSKRGDTRYKETIKLKTIPGMGFVGETRAEYTRPNESGFAEYLLEGKCR